MIADKRPVATLASPEYHDADYSLGKHFSGQNTPTTTLAYLNCTILAEIDIGDVFLNGIGAGAAGPIETSALDHTTRCRIHSPPPKVTELPRNRLSAIPIDSNADYPGHHMTR